MSWRTAVISLEERRGDGCRHGKLFPVTRGLLFICTPVRHRGLPGELPQRAPISGSTARNLYTTAGKLQSYARTTILCLPLCHTPIGAGRQAEESANLQPVAVWASTGRAGAEAARDDVGLRTDLALPCRL